MVAGSSWVPGSVSSGGATSLDGLSDVSVSSNQITFGSASTTAILPADDNGVDLGSASYSFKDAHIQGVIHATQIKTGTPTFTLPTCMTFVFFLIMSLKGLMLIFLN